LRIKLKKPKQKNKSIEHHNLNGENNN